MIEFAGRVSNSTDNWKVCGKDIILAHRADMTNERTKEYIEKYEKALRFKLYREDETLLPDCFCFFGGIRFVKLGITFGKSFIDCFRYYADLFAAEWKRGSKRLCSKEIGIKYVFELMLPDVRYDFRYILDGTGSGEDFCRTVDQAFEKVWVPEVRERMAKLQSLEEVCYRVGAVRTYLYMCAVGGETEYIKAMAKRFTERREVISMEKLQRSIFGSDSADDVSSRDLIDLLRTITSEEKQIQFSRFPAENRRSMTNASDEWVLYEQRGLELRSLRLPFHEINSPLIKVEIKAYCRYRFSGKVRANDLFFSSLVRAVNILTENDPRISCFADVTQTDAKRLQLTLEERNVSQTMIHEAFTVCRSVSDYLMGDDRESDLRTPKPSENVFKRLRFVNCGSFHGTTAYMPENVINGITEHLSELAPGDALMFRIMTETAMRANEAARLESDCLSRARYEKYVKLSYIPYKTCKARRRGGIPDRHEVYISHALADGIRSYAEETKVLRDKYGLPYLFLQEKTGRKSSMIDMNGFAIRMNKLIEKYNLCDSSGKLWHYTNHQCRKTVAVNMVENGASSDELAYKLGHLSRTTALKYYAEVRTARLAEMNGEFFRKQFEMSMNSGQLDNFNEEERRQLYVDFRLGLRRVEFGMCLKKPGDICRHMAVHCASCNKLCTGVKYLSHWNALLESEKDGLEQYIADCKAGGITDCTDHAEYKRLKELIGMYQSVIDSIGGDNV